VPVDRGEAISLRRGSSPCESPKKESGGGMPGGMGGGGMGGMGGMDF
jgi:hypothetical protein